MVRKKSVAIAIICLAILVSSSIVYFLKKETDSRFGIRENKIKSVEMYNSLGQKKVITNFHDKKRLLSIIESVRIVKSNIDPLIGMGYTITINYNDGSQQSFHFLGSSMNITENNKEIWYQIREDILQELDEIYSTIKK